MPTPADVVLKFTGKKWCDSPPPAPPSKFVALVTAPRTATFSGSGTMAPAFFEKSSDWNRARDTRAREAGPADLQQVQAEREGEQTVAALWGEAAAAVRQKAYEEDKFALEADKAPKAITPRFKNADGTFKVKALIEARCARCHKKDGDDSKAESFPLESYAHIEKYLAAPISESSKEGGGWYRVQEPIGIEKLTQSTHAHLLSFAVLFSLTGLIFAFSSYPSSFRCLLGPAVVIAVFADVALWWLARTCDQWGPYFAWAIIFAGGVTGTALALQIVLSLFNMYGAKGKVVVALLLLLLGGAGTLLFFKNIAPALTKPELSKSETLAPVVKDGVGGTGNTGGGNGGNGGNQPDPPKGSPSEAERLLGVPKDPNGKDLPWDQWPFNAADDGGMATAFCKGEPKFKSKMNDENVPQAEKDKLLAERNGERQALLAWIRTADPARKAAYDTDKFALPPDLVGKPITADYSKDGKQVLVRTLINDRCVRCHQPGAKREDSPFETYEGMLKYITPPPPMPPAPKGN
jgi:cytochrome c553